MKIQKTEAENLSIISKILPKLLKIKPIKVDTKMVFVNKIDELGLRLQNLCKEATIFNLNDPEEFGSQITVKFNIDIEYGCYTKNGYDWGWCVLINEETTLMKSKEELIKYFSSKYFLPNYIEISQLIFEVSTASSEIKLEHNFKS